MTHAEHSAHQHGNSVAAWTAVSIITLGFLVGGIGVWLASPVTFYVGVGLCVLGVVVGKVLALMGFGVSRPGHPVESATGPQ
jgi:hypothetical protein